MGGNKTMKTLKQKIEDKFEKEHSNLETSIKWMEFRRILSGIILTLSALAMYASGPDAGLVFLLFFVLPSLILYVLQTNKLKKKKAKLLELEKTILRGNE